MGARPVGPVQVISDDEDDIELLESDSDKKVSSSTYSVRQNVVGKGPSPHGRCMQDYFYLHRVYQLR